MPNRRLLESARNKHIVAFLGNTGSGKSTLVNLLAGKNLIVGPDGEDYILANSDDVDAMAIGTSGNSETLYPKFIDVGNLRFFDLPGFNDTDGSERNLVNAAFIRQILLGAASVRLVFVAGQDQFTADRSASIKRMFNSIKQLFVVDGQGETFVDDGIFVATKVTCRDTVNIPEFLVKKTDARDKEELNNQLQSWNNANRLYYIFHPVRGNNNAVAGENILNLISNYPNPRKILGVNVSALYPPETVSSLERMFLHIMDAFLSHKIEMSPTSVSDYDVAIGAWSSEDFWSNFDAELCGEEKAVGLLKEFCINPYRKTLTSFERDNERKRKNHINALEERRGLRIADIERRTGEKTEEVIKTLVPRSNELDFIAFDFAYHKDFYDPVCGPNSIESLATDPKEQEIVRRHYAGLISQHSHQQMMSWMQKFSGVEALTRRLALVERQLAAQQAVAANTETIERPVSGGGVVVPAFARNHRDVYLRFMNGKLIYRPTPGNDEGKIELLFRNYVNPETLEGTFDLSQCGGTGQHLSIATGYRKGKIVANAKKVETWFAPRFLIERDLITTAAHLNPIMGNWQETSPIGIFWTWGGWDNMGWYDYLTNKNIEEVSNNHLYENWEAAAAHCTGDNFRARTLRARIEVMWRDAHGLSCFVCELR